MMVAGTEYPKNKAERKIIVNATELQDSLKEGWLFDPWLCSKGYPIMYGETAGYWVLVKGTAEEIAEINPFVELPPPDPVEDEKPRELPFVATDAERIPFDKEGKKIRDPPPGYVIMHKDHITTTGVVYTKIPDVEPEFLAVIEALKANRLTVIPYCPDCDGVPLTPHYNSAYEVQGFSCPECGRMIPLGEKLAPVSDPAKPEHTGGQDNYQAGGDGS